MLLGSLVLNDIQSSTRIPSFKRTTSAAIQFAGSPDVGEPAMNDDVVTFYKNHPRLIVERRRLSFDEVEEPVSSRLDMSAVLNVVGRLEPLRRRVVALIERGIEGLQYDELIFSAFESFIARRSPAGR
jgi:hypothetical protein